MITFILEDLKWLANLNARYTRGLLSDNPSGINNKYAAQKVNIYPNKITSV